MERHRDRLVIRGGPITAFLYFNRPYGQVCSKFLVLMPWTVDPVVVLCRWSGYVAIMSGYVLWLHSPASPHCSYGRLVLPVRSRVLVVPLDGPTCISGGRRGH